MAYYRFISSAAGPAGIYLIDADGENNQLLLASQGWTRDLRFSPDGTHLSMTGGGEVFLFDMKTKQLRQLTTTAGNAQMADWSPNSTSVVISGVFTRYAGDGGLHVIDVPTGTARGLNQGHERVYGENPRWSPQGEPIVFGQRDNSAHGDICSIRSDGTDLRRLTDSAGDGWNFEDPRWVFGGTHILCRAARNGRGGARRESRIMRADGGDQRRWPVLVTYYDAISPDSRHVVFAAEQADTSQVDGLPVWVLFVRDLDDAGGSSIRQLTTYQAAP